MAEVRHTEIFDCTPEQFFSVVYDCEKYSEFLSEVQSCKILKDDGGSKDVEYKISVIKTFTYINKHTENAPHSLKFHYLSGDLFKSMEGGWDIQPHGEQTKVEYTVRASFGLFVPGGMTKKVIGANLPAMMKSYHKRIQQLFGS